MWKKDSNEPNHDSNEVTSPAAARARESRPGPARGTSRIGAATRLQGEISGQEDLVVDGQVEGAIQLAEYTVTIASTGKIKGDVRARVVEIAGEVSGNLTALERLTIRPTGRVQGDLVSPSVSIEDGSRFQGSIDMSSAEKAPKQAAASSEVPSDSSREGSSRDQTKSAASTSVTQRPATVTA